MRNILALLVLLCAPGALFVIGRGLLLIYETDGLVAFMLSCAIIAVAGLGIASLLDTRQDPPSRRQGGR